MDQSDIDDMLGDDLEGLELEAKDDEDDTLEALGFTFDEPPEALPLPEPSCETEELSASESLRERGCLYGNPHNLEFLPLMAVEVYANDGVQYVSTDPTVQYITAGKDMSEAWDPVIAYSRMNMAQQVLLAQSSVLIQAAWLEDPLADEVKYITAISSGGLITPKLVLTNSHAVLERRTCKGYISALQVPRSIQAVSGTQGRPEFFASAHARRLLGVREEVKGVDQVKYAKAKLEDDPNADVLLEESTSARTNYGTAGLPLPRTSDPVTSEYYSSLNVLDPDLAVLDHVSEKNVKVPLGKQLVNVKKLEPMPSNSPFMLPCLLFDPETTAGRGYKLESEAELPILFAGFPGGKLARQEETPEDFCPEYLKELQDHYKKSPQDAAAALKNKVIASFDRVKGVAFCIASVAKHKKKLVLSDTAVGHKGLTNNGFSGAKGTDPYAPLGTFQYVHCGPAELHYVDKNVDWADPEQERFGFDSTTQRVIPPAYNMAIPSHSPRFAATVVVPLLRSLKPHSEVWKHPRFPGAKSALPPFRRLIQFHLPLLNECEIGPNWKAWLEFVIKERNTSPALRTLDEDESEPSTPDRKEFKAIVSGPMTAQIAAYLGMSVTNWRLHAAQSRLGVVIAEFADLYGEHDEEGRFQRQPYDVSGWPWKLPADLELRRWDDVLWLYRRLRKGMDSITNYIPKGLLATYDPYCLPPEKEAKSFKLNNGAEMPAVGFGTRTAARGEVGSAVTAALEAGHKHIDCAAANDKEVEIGTALSSALKKGTIKREALWVTSKLRSTDQGPGEVEPALRKTLTNLQLEYVDLFVIDMPVRIRQGGTLKREDRLPLILESTWQQMEDVQKKGLAKAIGVSNFTVKKLNNLLKLNRTFPAINQIESHPLWPQDKLIKFCHSNGIHVSAHSPLGSKDVPRVEGVPKPPVLLENEVVKKIAKETGKSKGQVLLKWGLQRVTSVVSESTNPEDIKQNLDVLDWTLSDEAFEALSKIEPKMRLLDCKGTWAGDGCPIPTVYELWDGEVTTPKEY